MFQTENETVVATTEAQEAIADLDFTMIRMKLADANEGKGWDQQQLDSAEDRYRKFLTLNLLYPDLDIVPTGDIDTFWHAHILDTAKYQVDCDRVFGKMLHHFPYFGMRSESDAQDLFDAFESTKKLWVENFHESYADDGDNPEKCKKASCTRTQCKPQKCK
ncbi:MAG: glycine-rich domain-containing protein-like [Bradyrhizobiaceae bacterium]|nr:glycine-rich domain-containing protein-like [Bradyrhizobiaceae bacterium]